MRNNMNLNWLRSFEAAARLLSFTQAASEIGLTQTAVSQHIKALEMNLGEDLFIRRPKSVRLTSVGKAYLVSVRSALETIELSTRGLFGPTQENTIVVRGSMALMNWIAPRLETFLSTHPNVGVKLVTSLWRQRREEQPVDVDIILAPNAHERPNMKKLADECLVPVTHVSQSALVKTPADLLTQNQIHIFGFDDHWGRYLGAHGFFNAPSNGRISTDTSTTAIEMIATGLGCAVMLERFAAHAVESGRPVAIVGRPVSLNQSHFLLKSDLRSDAQLDINAFENWLVNEFLV